MEDPYYRQIAEAIQTRRSIKPTDMNGQIIPEQTISELLELANWAPTHAHTEPWHFFVFSGNALHQFGATHARLYWDNTDEDKRLQATCDKLKAQVEKPSHLIVAVMKRGANTKIPVLEEIAATSAAIQNILLAATAKGIASFWSTGGMTLKPAMKAYFKLAEEDQILGLIYLGYADGPAKEGIRKIPLSAKITYFQ